ncbi:meiosis-specific protein MEI4 [Phacochoerus africanus]|uniref:meiosis-specific protein MEI4 n=1 Tax=Phacochoerus africanus TaxID=41426 RepID=UPI001FD93E4F|nr:meiosis-specific protein MEI4 [Phacochoerus africanus]
MDDQAWFLRTSKLALALAIIRSKPADQSSREYTEHLARVVSGQEAKWRSKVEALEAEVLQLRQKLLLSRICSGPIKTGDPSSQLQPQERRSSENTPDLLEDSGCDLSSEQRIEPSEMPPWFVESCLPTPFPPLPIVDRCHLAPENPLSSHMQFLQHLLELKNLTESGSLKTDLSHFENDSSTVYESAFRLLDGLITFYQEPKLPCSSFWTEAVGTLAKLISDSNLSNHILKKCSKKLEEFEKTLLQVILKNSHINRGKGERYTGPLPRSGNVCNALKDGEDVGRPLPDKWERLKAHQVPCSLDENRLKILKDRQKEGPAKAGPGGPSALSDMPSVVVTYSVHGTAVGFISKERNGLEVTESSASRGHLKLRKTDHRQKEGRAQDES